MSTNPDHLEILPSFGGVCVTQSLVFMLCFVYIFLFFVLFFFCHGVVSLLSTNDFESYSVS